MNKVSSSINSHPIKGELTASAEHHRTLDTLLRFGALINSSLNIEAVLDRAMKGVEEFMNTEASTVYEIDEDGETLFIRMARGNQRETARNIRLKVGEGVAGRVVQSGEAMVVNDVQAEPAFNDRFDRETGFKTRSMICVPLKLRDRPIGALQVLNKRSGESFTQSDTELLTIMSQQIAIALDNAKLYQRLEEKFEQTAQELSLTQERLIRSERLSALGHLVQGVAHEIRNPVTTIGGFARRIKNACTDDATLSGYTEIILEQAQRLEELVQRVRQFADTLVASRRTAEVRPILDQLLERFQGPAEAQHVVLRTFVDERLPKVQMDPSQLFVALSNLIENAFEAMPKGGRLSIEASRLEKEIELRIRDTGRGIRREDLQGVYDPFFTSKTQGAGLGLTMVHQIVMNHKGDISIQSQEGIGTTVTLRIPIST